MSPRHRPGKKHAKNLQSDKENHNSRRATQQHPTSPPSSQNKPLKGEEESERESEDEFDVDERMLENKEVISIRASLRESQKQLDELREKRRADRQRLADMSNNQKAIKRNHSVIELSSDEEQPPKKKKDIESAGKQFAIQYHMFLPDTKVLAKAKLSATYDPKKRFSSHEMEIQGILSDILDVLPSDMAESCRADKKIGLWILNIMRSAMSTERSVAVRRIRKEVGHRLFGCESSLLNDPETRSTHRDLGARGLQDDSDDYYFNVDILHDNYSGEFNLDSIFLNPCLIRAYSALIHGVESVDRLIEGKSPLSSVETSSGIWQLREVTPGAIATAAVTVLYALSSDQSFRSQGKSSGIDWDQVHNKYFEFLYKGKVNKRRSVLNIFRVWNDTVFPHLAKTQQPGAEKNKTTTAAMTALEKDAMESSDKEEN